MKMVKFTLSLPSPLTGIMEYDDDEYEDAVSSGEIHYHGLDFLSADEALVLTYEVVDDG
jgi:hypothetical protein